MRTLKKVVILIIVCALGANLYADKTRRMYAKPLKVVRYSSLYAQINHHGLFPNDLRLNQHNVGHEVRIGLSYKDPIGLYFWSYDYGKYNDFIAGADTWIGNSWFQIGIGVNQDGYGRIMSFWSNYGKWYMLKTNLVWARQRPLQQVKLLTWSNSGLDVGVYYDNLRGYGPVLQLHKTGIPFIISGANLYNHDTGAWEPYVTMSVVIK